MAMRIIMFLLKSLVGLFAAIGFLVVAGLVVSSLLWRQVASLAERDVDVPTATVLTLDLSPGIVEARPDSPLARASMGKVLVMRDVLRALDEAGRDERVRGLMLRVGRASLGMAEAQELRDAIAAFRAKDKFAVAFAETLGDGGNRTIDYYLASATGEIWLQPSGDLALTGFHLRSLHVRGLLDKIGVVPRFDQREEYKAAMNMFTDTELPEAPLRNFQALAESWLNQVVTGSAADRGISPERLRELIDQAPYDAAAARRHGLIDYVGYLDEARDAALTAAGDDADFLDIGHYVRSLGDEDESGAVVALVYGLGPVALAESENDPLFGSLVMGSDTVAAAIRDAVDDPAVRAIVFRVASPGGSYVGSDAIWREVNRARNRGVPVVVSMGNIATSGGYFVAASAHAIVAQPGTVTGSIGAFAGKMVVSGFLDKIGIGLSDVKAGDNADMWAENGNFSPEGWAHLQAILDRVYADFTKKVADGRNLPIEQVLVAAKGQIWSGEDALALGLVDALGGLTTARALASEAAGIGPGQPVRLKVFPEERDPIEAIIEQTIAGDIRSPALRNMARGVARLVQAMAPVLRVFETLSGESPGPMLRAPDLRPAG